jgi:hypothetical protein
MKRKSLINTNSHLKDPRKREEMIVRFAYSAGKKKGLKITLRDTRKAYKKVLKKKVF